MEHSFHCSPLTPALSPLRGRAIAYGISPVFFVPARVCSSLPPPTPTRPRKGGGGFSERYFHARRLDGGGSGWGWAAGLDREDATRMRSPCLRGRGGWPCRGVIANGAALIALERNLF